MEADHELMQETWAEYFDAASRELLNAPVSVEIEIPAQPSETEVDRLALQLLTYDGGDDVVEISATQDGLSRPSVVCHMVEHPQRILVDAPMLSAPLTIAVDDRDGVRTLIKIERPEDLT